MFSALAFKVLVTSCSLAFMLVLKSLKKLSYSFILAFKLSPALVSHSIEFLKLLSISLAFLKKSKLKSTSKILTIPLRLSSTCSVKRLFCFKALCNCFISSLVISLTCGCSLISKSLLGRLGYSMIFLFYAIIVKTLKTGCMCAKSP